MLTQAKGGPKFRGLKKGEKALFLLISEAAVQLIMRPKREFVGSVSGLVIGKQGD